MAVYTTNTLSYLSETSVTTRKRLPCPCGNVFFCFFFFYRLHEIMAYHQTAVCTTRNNSVFNDRPVSIVRRNVIRRGERKTYSEYEYVGQVNIYTYKYRRRHPVDCCCRGNSRPVIVIAVDRPVVLTYIVLYTRSVSKRDGQRSPLHAGVILVQTPARGISARRLFKIGFDSVGK